MYKHIQKVAFNINLVTGNSKNFIDLISSQDLSDLNLNIIQTDQFNVSLYIEDQNIKEISRKLLNLFKLLEILN